MFDGLRRRVVLVLVAGVAWIGDDGLARAGTAIPFIQRITKLQPGGKTLLIDQLVRTDGQAKPTVLREGKSHSMRGVSIAPDGTVLVLEAGEYDATDPKPRFVMLKPDGSVMRIVNLDGLEGIVFGSPVLLPDKQQIGFSFCKTGKAGDKLPAGGGGKLGERNPFAERSPLAARPLARPQGRLQQIQATEPVVAVVDLEGKHFKEIGPGALPRWSADGREILFSAVAIVDKGSGTNVMMRWGKSRLSVMDAAGGNVRRITEEATFDGAWNADGTKIAYMDGSGRTPVIKVCGADGSDVRTVVDVPNAACSSPRWAGERLAYHLKIHVPTSADIPAWSAIWTVGLGGEKPRRVPSTTETDPNAGIDFDAEELTFTATHDRHDAIPAATKEKEPENKIGKGGDLKSVPAGQTVTFEGTKVFFRDAKGKLTPAPDGDYRLPGSILHVRNGQTHSF